MFFHVFSQHLCLQTYKYKFSSLSTHGTEWDKVIQKKKRI